MRLRFLLAVAVLCNVVLLALLFLLPGKSRNIQEAAVSNDGSISQPGGAGISSQKAFETRGLDWRSVESEDYTVYIRNLRAIKCPEETIRDIIVADVNKLYARRKARVQFSSVSSSFWLPDSKLKRIYADQLQQLRALDEERRQVLRDLLGFEDNPEPIAGSNGSEATLVRLSFLPQDKRDKVMSILDRYGAEEDQIYVKARQDGRRVPSPEQLNSIRDRREAEISSSLSPSEYEQYQFRFHYRGDNLRTTLYGFNPSEDEFRYLFNLSKPIDDKWEFFDLNVDQNREKRQAELTALNEQIKAQFGEQRYAEYDRCWSRDYKSLRALAEKFDLPGESVVKSYDVVQSLKSEQQRIYADPATTEIQKQNDMMNAYQKTYNAIKALMGEQAAGEVQLPLVRVVR